MSAHRLTICPLTGGRVFSLTIQPESPADLLERVAAAVSSTARRLGVSPSAVDYELAELA